MILDSSSADFGQLIVCYMYLYSDVRNVFYSEFVIVEGATSSLQSFYFFPSGKIKLKVSKITLDQRPGTFNSNLPAVLLHFLIPFGRI